MSNPSNSSGIIIAIVAILLGFMAGYYLRGRYPGRALRMRIKGPLISKALSDAAHRLTSIFEVLPREHIEPAMRGWFDCDPSVRVETVEDCITLAYVPCPCGCGEIQPLYVIAKKKADEAEPIGEGEIFAILKRRFPESSFPSPEVIQTNGERSGAE